MAASNSAGPTYPLQRSVRLRSSASAYFTRTPATTTNQTTFTLSCWIKLGAGGGNNRFYVGRTGINFPSFAILFGGAAGLLSIDQYTTGGATQFILTASSVYRDPSSWYHLVFAVDTTQATASNRVKIYVNGVQVTAFSTATYPAQNLAINVNTTNAQYIGAEPGGPYYYDGYFSEFNFIDGQALTPSSFGAYNNYGVWSPAKFTGTYGTNGYYLNFQDNSSVTTTANVGIGKDSSGNGNYWTSNGINVSPYTGTPPVNNSYDSMLDVPTNTSAVNANFAVMNPVDTGGGTIANGNLTVTSVGTNVTTRATIAIPTTGKWYFETTDVVSGGNNAAGISNRTLPVTTNPVTSTGAIYASMFRNSVFGFALNFDAMTYVIYENNVSVFSGSITAGIEYVPFVYTSSTSGSSTAFNFGQRPFSYTPPTGFKSLNTFNLPDSIVPIGAQYFAASLWTGNNTSQSIVNTVNGTSMQPDFVWLKSRSSASWVHFLQNTVRGISNFLVSNSTAAETTTSPNIVGAVNSTGFTVLGNSNSNNNLDTYVGWQWRASNATAVTNTAGTVSSQVSANQTAGFSIVTFTCPASGAYTVGHGLGVTPSLIIVKDRTNNVAWFVYHKSVSTTTALFLIFNTAAGTSTSAGIWGSALPSPTVFGNTAGQGIVANANAIAYCWSEVPGYSKFGSYTGNGLSDGTFVYTGFKPRFIMVKRTDATGGNWQMYDTSQNPFNVSTTTLAADSAGGNGSFTSGYNLDIVSNGFKWRATGVNVNASTAPFIYAAFAENPFKNALAR
jgi:hypothetical protein